ncbi:uncharacterized protein LACBIDRAFT_328048 [Laccaria bicolor S238N-H82]|uniref:Predicted protein n=1 Tax=Laccaria bicolor (strain S238N-H82 / ATCC MYA-4686) TaxID=486041 RepID=B0DDL1_LACBS|nr:uncharacterized protein LACBIDRAFT_328048 [Laccaria bicolor S238N-H82]EDR07235.1 predicted protein [Laccaria bicolor S238N-H82]|eukprot:XP_001882166.1 predicted protein [Laccaria bicolor S238N-H82]
MVWTTHEHPPTPVHALLVHNLWQIIVIVILMIPDPVNHDRRGYNRNFYTGGEDDEYRHTRDFTPGHNQSRYHEIDSDYRGDAREAPNPPSLDRQHTSHNEDGHRHPDRYNAGPARSHYAIEDPHNLAKRSYNEEDVGHPVMGATYPEPPPKKRKISQLDDGAIRKVAPLPARRIPSGGRPTSPNNGRPGSSKDLSRGYPPNGRR